MCVNYIVILRKVPLEQIEQIDRHRKRYVSLKLGMTENWDVTIFIQNSIETYKKKYLFF